MTDAALAQSISPSRPVPRFYYGWVNVVVAAVAMVATLPGRSQGLGLVTEPLLRDLKISRIDFGAINLVATLIGSAFCLGCGPLIDRLGARIVLAAVAAALGATVIAMGHATNSPQMLIALILTRGLGQSALSVVSITIVGKWFVRRLPAAMGVYAVLVGIGFVIAFPTVGYAVMRIGWRPVWSSLGWMIGGGLGAIGWLLVRRSPESIGLQPDGTAAAHADTSDDSELSLTLGQALRTLSFWAFALAGFAFSLVSSGLMLFNEAVLKEHGVDSRTVLIVLAVITFMGLAANLLGGWLAERWPIGRLMASAMFLLAVALFTLPLARGLVLIYLYAATMGTAAGVVTVVFFVCWPKLFGRRHLGSIQGAAQLLTVLASATGPWLLAESIDRTGSSTPLMFLVSPLVAVLGGMCLAARPRSGNDESRIPNDESMTNNQMLE
jgi:MFS family permease